MKKLLKKAFVFFFCGFMFFGVAYAYLSLNFNKPAAMAEEKEYNVPYERLPQNKGIAFAFSDGSALLAYLDFEDSGIRLLNIDEFVGDNQSYSGYFADYTIQIDYRLIEGIIDRVGGINLNYNGEILRYTGAQVIELVSTGHGEELKHQIILKIFEQISKNAFSKDDFVYIIENSESNISIIDCLYWIDYLKEISGNISFIN